LRDIPNGAPVPTEDVFKNEFKFKIVPTEFSEARSMLNIEVRVTYLEILA